MNAKKLAITYICTGKYNVFFDIFYQSYKQNFCKGNTLTFVVITDKPALYRNKEDCKVYYLQRHYKENDLNFIKFRKWKDILLAEDFLMTQDYCFYINSNLTCVRPVTLDELFRGKDQYAVTHSLFDINKMPMYESLCSSPRSSAYFKGKDRDVYPNYRYYQAGNVGATSKRFLMMCNYIESSRCFDCYYDYTKFVPWHDETYYNKYINSEIKRDPKCINILDGKKYLCTWLNELKPYAPTCKMMLVEKNRIWKNNKI